MKNKNKKKQSKAHVIRQDNEIIEKKLRGNSNQIKKKRETDRNILSDLNHGKFVKEESLQHTSRERYLYYFREKRKPTECRVCACMCHTQINVAHENENFIVKTINTRSSIAKECRKPIAISECFYIELRRFINNKSPELRDFARFFFSLSLSLDVAAGSKRSIDQFRPAPHSRKSIKDSP